MQRKILINALLIAAMVISMLAVMPANAAPPAPGDEPVINPGQSVEGNTVNPLELKRQNNTKSIDQPNIKDYLRNMERQRLLAAGQTAEAAALAQSGTDRVLVLLVEFAGTDVVTWNEGDTWDPLGIADPNEFTGTIGDCSNIITQTQTFTYTGPLHNQIPRPLSLEDRSGDSIWTEDFSPEWFDAFMFQDGVVISYTMEDGTPVSVDFTGQSVADYYDDLSDGQYNIVGDIVGWLQVDHSTQWYDADQCPGARSGASTSRGVLPGGGNARDLVRDTLDAVNDKIAAGELPDFDWTDYDLDGNGVIDRLWIVHAGYGEEDGTDLLNRTDYGESAVWSHSSAVTPAYVVDAENGISAGPYIVMPENGGIGVFAHEYGHNLGADDLYAYGNGDTSAGFWTLMSDDWTGYPIGFEPPAVDPWHLENWGWLNPMVITDTNKVYEFDLGQASRFPGGEDVYRGAKIALPDAELPLAAPVWDGDYYWWGGQQNVANAAMTLSETISIPAGVTTATLQFDLVYDIEDEWDFLWIQTSADGGTSWDTLTNANTQCEHDPGWIGGEYGFPDDLCGAGLGGFYGYNASFPLPEQQVFDLTSYAGEDILLRFWYMTDWGTLYSGPFMDNVAVIADSVTLFSDDAETADGPWEYDAPWTRNNGTLTASHNFYLQWRNTGENGGYDSALGESRWRFGPANTGLVMWYNNNYYNDNEVENHLTDYPGFGPKGRMLVIDSHPEPYRDPAMVELGWNNEGGNLRSRGLMRDAPFTLKDQVDFVMEPPEAMEETAFEGGPAEKAFHDAFGYYPGAEFVHRGSYYPPDQFKWVTKQWDASVVMPATEFYGINAPGYTGSEEFRFECTPYIDGPYAGALGCYWFPGGIGYDGTSGNPAEFDAQYGWHVELIEQSADNTTAKVRVWNSRYAAETKVEADVEEVQEGGTVGYDVTVKNAGSQADFLVCAPFDPEKLSYVPGSASAGAQLLSECPAVGMELGEVVSAAEAGAVAWYVHDLPTGAETYYDFEVKVKDTAGAGELIEGVKVYTGGASIYTVDTLDTVMVWQLTYLPLTAR